MPNEYKQKFLFFDTETTGLAPTIHEIWNFAGIVCFRDKYKLYVLETLEFFSSVDINKIDPKLIEMEMIDVEALEGYLQPAVNHSSKLKPFLQRYVNQYKPADKLIPVAYNADFDMNFLRAWFIDQQDKYFGSYFYQRPIDILSVVMDELYQSLHHIMPGHTFKLFDVAKLLQIATDEDKLHTASYDARLSLRVYAKLKNLTIVDTRKEESSRPARLKTTN